MISDLLGPEPLTHKDLRLLSMAMKDRWQIPTAILRELPIKLCKDAMNVRDDGTPNTVDLESQHRATALLIRMVQNNADAGPVQIQPIGMEGSMEETNITLDFSNLSLAEAEALQAMLEKELQVKNPIAVCNIQINENTEAMDKE